MEVSIDSFYLVIDIKKRKNPSQTFRAKKFNRFPFLHTPKQKSAISSMKKIAVQEPFIFNEKMKRNSF